VQIPLFEDVTIPDAIVKVERRRCTRDSIPGTPEARVNSLISRRNAQQITSGLPALPGRIRALTKFFSAKNPQKTISNLLKMN
jgi:hypothetical protein